MKKSEEKFSLDPTADIKTGDKAHNTERSFEDLNEKQRKLFIRIYEFTPDLELQTKFGLNRGELEMLKMDIKDKEGISLKKNPSYSRSVVAPNPANKPAKNSQTPAHMLAKFMNSVGEEERRELINLYEEGMQPIDLMKQLIVIQSSRIIRGASLEQGSTQLHKTMNEAAADMGVMITKLHEMEEGQKVTLGFDDSFIGLVLASQKRKDDDDL